MNSPLSPASEDVTQILVEWCNGSQEALDRLMPLVYDELRRIANRHLRRERPDHTLQTTALVHEAFLKLIDQRHVTWQNRSHFFGVAAQLMRRILVDHARGLQTTKRGGKMVELPLDEAFGALSTRSLNLIALDDALNRLTELDSLQSRIIELRYFGGLSIEETAEFLDISSSTVKREWNSAKAWLYRQICK